jgi:transposase-like protein
LTAARDPDAPHDGRSNRRSFRDEEKLAVVLESEQPGMSAAEACRRHRIVASMVFRWRVQFAFAGKKDAKLAEVTLVGSGVGGSLTPCSAERSVASTGRDNAGATARLAALLCARRQRSGAPNG